jgi:hypothetical protein
MAYDGQLEIRNICLITSAGNKHNLSVEFVTFFSVIYVSISNASNSFETAENCVCCCCRAHSLSICRLNVQPVFELPGVGGFNPPVVCLTPKQDALGYPGGQFQPPPLFMMLNRLCVMTMTMNRQMSTPLLIF